MILELASISIVPQQKAQFEAAFMQARKIISSMDGFVSHQLQRCMEVDGRYVLLVQWRTLENHTVGFRGSPQFLEWRALLGPYFAATPVTEHFELISSGEYP